MLPATKTTNMENKAPSVSRCLLCYNYKLLLPRLLPNSLLLNSTHLLNMITSITNSSQQHETKSNFIAFFTLILSMGCGGSKGGSANGGALSPGRKSDVLITSKNDEGNHMQINGGGSFRSCQGGSKDVEGIFVIAEELEEKGGGIAFKECATVGYLLPRREEKVDVVAGGEDGEYYSPVHEFLRKIGDDADDDDDVSDSVTRDISEVATVRRDELK